jgi:hypothetical protein
MEEVLLKKSRFGDSQIMEVLKRADTGPPRPNCCLLNRIQTKGASTEWTWLDTDKHSKTERLQDCCRPRAP